MSVVEGNMITDRHSLDWQIFLRKVKLLVSIFFPLNNKGIKSTVVISVAVDDLWWNVDCEELCKTFFFVYVVSLYLFQQTCSIEFL